MALSVDDISRPELKRNLPVVGSSGEFGGTDSAMRASLYEKKMPKIQKVRRKAKSGSVSLLESLAKDSSVRSKRRRSSDKHKRDQEKFADDEIVGDVLGVDAANAKEMAKLEALSRDVLELEEDGLAPDVDDQVRDFGDDLTAYPMGGRLVVEGFDEGQGYKPQTLGDVLFAKMQERAREEAEAQKMALFKPTTVELFEKVGLFMSRYRSGKLPKALRYVPNLRNWLDILWLTKPENWTPHAVAAATPMFINSTSETMARGYMTYVLLPAFVKDLEASQKPSSAARLNVHLFEALCKCLYRAPLFFKAIYFPVILAEGGCPYRQAVLLSSVVARESITAVQAAAVILKLCQHTPQTNQIYYCILRLLNKKHNLPQAAVRLIAAYFLSAAEGAAAEEDETMSVRSTTVDRKSRTTLPVIWHQTLLVFVQRWAEELDSDQKEQFKILLKAQYHPKITPEVRRQLFRPTQQTSTDWVMD